MPEVGIVKGMFETRSCQSAGTPHSDTPHHVPPLAMTIPVLLLFGVAILTVQAISQDHLRTLLSKTEWMTYVGSDENEGVEVVWHDIGSGNVKGKLQLRVHGETVELQLKPASLLDPHLVLISRGDNGSRLLSPSLATSHSFYTHPGRAALALSQGFHGIIFSEIDDSYFLIRPLPARFHNRASQIPHVVVKKKITTKFGKLSRKTRSIKNLRPVHIETAVFVDRDLYQHMTTNFPKNTEQELVKFVLTMVNAVQMLYHDPSLGRPVSFVVKRLEILHVEPIGLVRSHDIDRFLGNFCVWQKEENPGEDSNPLHWDHALMLTGLDLYVLAKNGKISKQVVGLAPIAGMCTLTSSCTVNEGRHFESVYVVAHEIGHNLGMRHDGPLADNNCDPGSYLMSPTLGSGKITWSSCSRDYLDQFLHTPQSHCLMDHTRSVEQLDHSGDGLLPGERFTADQQCMLKYGRGSKHLSSEPVSNICKDLQCTRNGYTWTSHPALDGTHCGSEKWCRSGRCVGKRLGAGVLESPLTEGWSEWSPFSECASGCLTDDKGTLSTGSTGIMIASRFCIQPRPEDDVRACVGSERKFKTCVPYQCDKIPRTSIKNFADEICLRAREVDNELTGSGLQKISSSPEEACTVWCYKKSGETKTKGWTFPDGTSCQINRRNRPVYCISGVCQEFKCSAEDEVFSISPEMCSSTLFFSRDKRREVAVGVWVPISDCYYNCLSPGSGLRLVEKRPCRYCNATASVQLCTGDAKSCPAVKSTSSHATLVCTLFSKKVSRLSGLGMQLFASSDDPDRPCRIACQDEKIPYRFYMVNGEDGWYPFGTDCSRGDPIKKAFCISGKCLDFGSDETPIHESAHGFMDIHRHKRNADWKTTHLNESALYENKLWESVIDFKNPIFVNSTHLNYIEEIKYL